MSLITFIKKPVIKACDYICDYNRAMIMASVINKNLEKYKGVNKGKDVYIIGGGPSVKKFAHDKTDNDVYIGINRAFKDDRFDFDYLFAQDQFKEGFDEMLSYRGKECKKLLGIVTNDKSYRINEYCIQEDYERYVLACRRHKEIPVDISLEPFADLMGTVFSVLQFAVYTNPDRILLVGIDCNSEANIYNNGDNETYEYQLRGWEMMKEHLIKIGSYEKVFSINPVGLKGTFQVLNG